MDRRGGVSKFGILEDRDAIRRAASRFSRFSRRVAFSDRGVRARGCRGLGVRFEAPGGDPGAAAAPRGQRSDFRGDSRVADIYIKVSKVLDEVQEKSGPRGRGWRLVNGSMAGGASRRLPYYH